MIINITEIVNDRDCSILSYFNHSCIYVFYMQLCLETSNILTYLHIYLSSSIANVHFLQHIKLFPLVSTVS